MTPILSAILNADQIYPQCLKMMFYYYSANFVTKYKELQKTDSLSILTSK